jgi:hypothetical protein
VLCRSLPVHLLAQRRIMKSRTSRDVQALMVIHLLFTCNYYFLHPLISHPPGNRKKESLPEKKKLHFPGDSNFPEYFPEGYAF